MTTEPSHATRAEPPPARYRTDVTAVLSAYRGSNLARSAWQLGSSLAGFVCCWILAYRSLAHSYALAAPPVLAAAVFLVRLFIIQHDCGHGSFFRRRAANDTAGALLGVLTLTPYVYWRKLHAVHHATSGNLDRRGHGDIDTLTVREYGALDWRGRLRYRFLRNAIVILFIGPAYQFFIHHRLPRNLPLESRREWASVLVTNAGLVLLAFAAVRTVGLGPFLLVHLPVTWIAGAVGVWLFYVQHQFEQTYWARGGEWTFERASVAGSSYLDLPRLLHWCTGNIGYHHVHHLCPRIPNYRLRACRDAHPMLAAATRLTIRDSIRSLRLKLWDEDGQRLVGFRAARPARLDTRMLRPRMGDRMSRKSLSRGESTGP